MEQKRDPSQYFRSLTTEEKQKMYPTAFGSSLFNMYQNIDRYVNEIKARRLVFYKDKYYIHTANDFVYKTSVEDAEPAVLKFEPALH